ncbi:Uu.00g055250.m01.CDS01 [Anthostomella pinea]|uniref:Uu.00g055250.m01.CDS01 n=1 Tax=Anthostomella pinea TaxID=933095 RepID=A0AAI8VXP3_9PEZI|nr:Uu.00g055250.m01.CDS01 [Anthostomella pinea]
MVEYCEGVDHEALAWVAGTELGSGGTLVGSYGSFAEISDEISEVEGVEEVMFIFDEFLSGVDSSGHVIQPQMKSRSKVNGSA